MTGAGGGGGGVTVRAKTAVPVPPELIALMVTEKLPDPVGVPEINPVDVDTERPDGSPLAPYPVGLFVAAIW